MIVRPRPTVLGLLFTVRGSIVPLIAPKVLFIAAISAVVSALHHLRPDALAALPPTPFTLLGLGLSIFLGFRNSACYDRWWEARKQWGLLLTEARNLAREIAALLPNHPALQARLTRRVAAFAHTLAARLRNTELSPAQPWLPPDEADHLLRCTNPPDAILRTLTREFAGALRAGQIGEISFSVLETRVSALCAVQAACERIRATPTPFAYTLLLHRTAWLFCLLVPFALLNAASFAAPLVAAILAYTFFGLDAVGDALEEPFGLRPNTLPLNALIRTLEIELLEGLGETNLPKPLQPVDFVLQ